MHLLTRRGLISSSSALPGSAFRLGPCDCLQDCVLVKEKGMVLLIRLQMCLCVCAHVHVCMHVRTCAHIYIHTDICILKVCQKYVNENWHLLIDL